MEVPRQVVLQLCPDLTRVAAQISQERLLAEARPQRRGRQRHLSKLHLPGQDRLLLASTGQLGQRVRLDMTLARSKRSGQRVRKPPCTSTSKRARKRSSVKWSSVPWRILSYDLRVDHPDPLPASPPGHCASPAHLPPWPWAPPPTCLLWLWPQPPALSR